MPLFCVHLRDLQDNVFPFGSFGVSLRLILKEIRELSVRRAYFQSIQR